MSFRGNEKKTRNLSDASPSGSVKPHDTFEVRDLAKTLKFDLLGEPSHPRSKSTGRHKLVDRCHVPLALNPLPQ